jgi:PKD repeat protein
MSITNKKSIRRGFAPQGYILQDGLRAALEVAIALGQPLLLGLLLGALDGSERLSRLLPRAAAPEDGFLLRASPALDSALLYHNQAIADWDSLRRRPAPPTAPELEGPAAAFARARTLRGGDYPLATANAARNRFHQGLLRYHDFLQDRDTAALSQAEAFFQQALAMAAADTALASAVPLHARHALGLIAHCRLPRQPVAFEIFYALQAEGFFDTLRLQPNLRTLLFPDREGDAVRHDCLPVPQLERLSADTLCPGAALRLRLAPLAGADFFVLRWGDGQADTLPASAASQEISHVFSLRSGAISVRVLAFGECQEVGPAFNDAYLRVVLLAPPRARMQQSVQRGCSPLEVRFQALGRADEYRWDFGDGQQSSAPSPTVAYAAPGRYTVRLILRNACGADTLTLANAVEVLTAAECRTAFDLTGQVLAAGRGLPGARIAAGPPAGFAPDQAPYQLEADAEGRFPWRPCRRAPPPCASSSRRRGIWILALLTASWSASCKCSCGKCRRRQFNSHLPPRTHHQPLTSSPSSKLTWCA